MRSNFVIKRLLSVLLLSTLLLCAAVVPGCQKSTQGTAGLTIAYDQDAAGSKGFYHCKFGNSQGETYFYDYASQKSVPLCNKPNCTHDDPDTCDAFLMKSSGIVAEYAGSLYFTDSENYNCSKLYKAALDGTGRTELAKLATDNPGTLVFLDNRVFYVHTFKTLDKSEQPTGYARVSLNAVDLSTHKDSTVSPEYAGEGATISVLGAVGHTIYYSFQDSKVLADAKSAQEHRDDLEAFYTSLLKDYDLYAFDTQTGRQEKILTDLPPFTEVCFCGGSAYYFLTDDATHLSTLYRYDLAAKKATALYRSKDVFTKPSCYDGKIFFSAGVFNGKKVDLDSENSEFYYDPESGKIKSAPFLLPDGSIIYLGYETPDLFILMVAKNDAAKSGVWASVRKSDYYGGNPHPHEFV